MIFLIMVSVILQLPILMILGVRNVRVLENLACFVFLVTPVLRFAFLAYYRRFIGSLSRPIKWNLRLTIS